MEEKNIKLVLDKKSVLLGSDELDITNDIMSKLNEKLKSINLN
jgi:Skp family chaperone for outer membrane proteins